MGGGDSSEAVALPVVLPDAVSVHHERPSEMHFTMKRLSVGLNKPSIPRTLCTLSLVKCHLSIRTTGEERVVEWSIGNLQAMDRTQTTGLHAQMFGVDNGNNGNNTSLLEGTLVQKTEHSREGIASKEGTASQEGIASQEGTDTLQGGTTTSHLKCHLQCVRLVYLQNFNRRCTTHILRHSQERYRVRDSSLYFLITKDTEIIPVSILSWN